MVVEVEKLETYSPIAEKLKALAHPHRLCIVRGLLRKKGCHVGHMQECMNLPQSTVSQHLAKMRALGIVSCERAGLEVTYRVTDPEVIRWIYAIFPEDAEG